MSKGLKSVIILLGVLVGLLIAVYFVGAHHFRTHFFMGTTINGLDVSDDTADEVTYALQDKIREYTLTIKERGDETERITGEDLYMQYVDDGSINQLMKEQNAYLWFTQFWKKHALKASAGFTFDESRIDTILGTLNALKKGNMTAPEPDHIEDNGTQYEVVSGDQGTTLNYDKTKTAITEAVKEGKASVDLDKEDCYEKAADTDTAALQKQADSLNKMISANLYYNLADQKFTVDGSVVRSWIKTDDGGNVSLSRDAVLSWVTAMAKATDTFGLEHQFKTSTGETITLASGGDYGWVIRRDDTTDALIQAVSEGKTGELTPVYLYEGKDRGANDIGGTYAEVNISKQTMWIYKDGQLVVETPVVTGNEAKGTCTPSGSVWAIDAKKANAHFSASNVDVDYWLPFNDGCGIHDASWRKNYGGTIYKTNGSHGCVNTPHDAAGKAFETLDIGYPVIVYYSVDQVVGPQPTSAISAG